MNKSNWFFIAILLVIIGCRSKKKNILIVKEVPNNFQMYKKSELASLMRLMLIKNQELRQKIITKKSIGEFNEQYVKIHTANPTDSSQIDATYPAFANYFLKTQKELFLVPQVKQKEKFNNAVDACISCHKDRCAGPIPRIEKLRIH